jgi:hypothetical protein
LTESEAAVQERDRTGSEVLAVRRIDGLEILVTPWSRRIGGAEVVDDHGGVGVCCISCCPVRDGRDRACGVREAVGEARGVGRAVVELREKKVGENLRS